MAAEHLDLLKAAIEDAVSEACRDYGHPQAVDTVGDARDAILAAVGDYLAIEWGERALRQHFDRLSERGY